MIGNHRRALVRGVRPFGRMPQVLALGLAAALVAAACAPAAPASPTAAPAKPAATSAPAKAAPTAAPAKPAATSAPAKAAEKPAEKTVAKPTEKPAAKAEAKPAFDEQAVADFYRGKSIRIVVGFSPGGGYDTSSRLVAKHLSKYIPGNPNVVVENMEGAGSMIAANHVYRAAAKDGTVIGSFNSNLILLQALGKEGIEYDARSYNWLGSLGSSSSACVTRADGPVQSFQEVMNGKEWILAVEAPGTTTYDVPVVLKEALGANLKLVPGYAGTSKLRLAVEGKEVDGACWSFDSMRATAASWFEANPPEAKILVIMGSETPDHPWLKGVPAAETLAKTEDDKQLLRIVDAPGKMTWPLAFAPEVPSDRVQALRQALDKTIADPAFKADAEQAKLEVNYNNASAVAERVKVVLDTPEEGLNRLREILAG